MPWNLAYSQPIINSSCIRFEKLTVLGFFLIFISLLSQMVSSEGWIATAPTALTPTDPR